MSAKFLKIIRPAYVPFLTQLVNVMFESNQFPSFMKNSRITPVFKKEDALLKKYYRPVSVLPIRSKVFERAIVDQLSDHFESVFHPFLSAYRKGYGCQTPLLALTEEWWRALDDDHFAAAILMDLSKAFDCLSHNLLVEKLKAYNVPESAVKLISSYLEDRLQCVKIGKNKRRPTHVERGATRLHHWANIIQYFYQRYLPLYREIQSSQLC